MSDKKIIEGKRFWEISRLCMGISKEGKLNVDESKLKELKIVSQPKVYMDSNKSDAGFVANMEDGVVVAFKGTDGVRDIITDINITLTELKPYGDVHSGFYNAVSEIGPNMIEHIKEMLKELPLEKQVLYITGHSKGGAMATVFSCLAKDSTKNIKVITYGSPRLASEEFAKKYDIENYAYTSFLDAVPHIPFTKKERNLIIRQNPMYSPTAPILMLMDFFPIGQRIDVYVNRTPYSNLPKQQNNKYGETLNSWCAVEWMIRNKEFDLLDEVHNYDYSEVEDQTII